MLRRHAGVSVDGQVSHNLVPRQSMVLCCGSQSGSSDGRRVACSTVFRICKDFKEGGSDRGAGEHAQRLRGEG